MRVRLARLVLLCTVLGIAGTASAQYGHPLKGSWSGDWGTSKDKRNRVLIDLNWDGKAATGMLNPGSDSIPLNATFDPITWMVRIEGEGKDASGKPVRYVIEGKLENLGSPNRHIAGLWTQGSMKGDFKITRN